MTGSSKSNAPTMIALLGLLAAGGGLIAIAALVLPQALGLLCVIVGFFAFGAIHYLLWGWWMKPIPDDDAANNRPYRPHDAAVDTEP